MILENGRWVIDNFLGMTPEWAVPSDRKELYDEVLKLLTDYYGIVRNGDAVALDTFVQSHFSKHSRAAMDGRMLIDLEWGKGRPELLSPICLSVGPTTSDKGIDSVNSAYAFVVGFTDENGQHRVTVQHSNMALIKEVTVGSCVLIGFLQWKRRHKGCWT